MSVSAEIALLHRLCHLYGVQTGYTDVFRKRRVNAAPEALLAILRSLGAEADNLQQIPRAKKSKEQAIAQTAVEPVTIVQAEVPSRVTVRLHPSQSTANIRFHLKLESGTEKSGYWKEEHRHNTKRIFIGETECVQTEFALGARLPPGYHRLELNIDGRRLESLLISSPATCFVSQSDPKEKIWGAFLPLYALRKQAGWGGADFTSLHELIDWVGSLGGQLVGTLPLLPMFLDTPVNTSPYSPISRLAWNEFYIDIDAVPQIAECSEAQTIIRSADFQSELTALRSQPLVDYGRTLGLKRLVLEKMSNAVFSRDSALIDDVKAFASEHHEAENFAKFRAVHEKQKVPWHSWTERLQCGVIHKDDYALEDYNYHLYTQFLAFYQMEGVAAAAEKSGARLYLDLPLGVHQDGYDTWRFRESFIQGGRIGAPPDIVFTKGQDWGLPPPHPQKMRESGYDYFIRCVRHHLKYADVLRIDHVMGFHRLFCIPPGADTKSGVYIKYPAEEFYAILAVESHRTKAMIVGEDLGMVPRYVRHAMKRHCLQNLYVLHYELAGGDVNPVPSDSLACLNTHDMPPFAAFWQGGNIERRFEIGLINDTEAQKERVALETTKQQLANFLRSKGWLGESNDTQDVMEACLCFLAASPAAVTLVNLEDLWLETEPQNIPSTTGEYPNWKKKTRPAFEEFCQSKQAIDILLKVNELRSNLRAV